MPNRESRQLLLLMANVVFYGSGTPWHLLVLGVPSIVDYACAIRIAGTSDGPTRRRWLVLSLACNLGLLGYFKYADFFVDTIAGFVGVSTAPLSLVLPVGISFFTFKTMSYTIDVYRREIPACRSLWRYAMFVSYFPELVAGPIVRASVFLPQMDRELEPRWRRMASGLQIALLGLAKKLLIADRLASFVDAVFDHPAAFSQGTVIAAVIAYSLQIYCDFSGYSDIAIGVSRVIGFDLPENFNMPYAATSITEFWRRWHMTLSGWLRDYLYIPLGGNRRGKLRMYVNLAITMLLGGLWHGANWTFVAWGLLHGVGLAAHKLWREWRIPTPAAVGSLRLTTRVLSWAATYSFVCVGWIFFRAPDFATAAVVLQKVTGLSPGGASWLYLPLFLTLPVVILAHAIGARLQRGSVSLRAVGWNPALRRRLQLPAAAFRVDRRATTGNYLTLRRPGFVSAAVLTALLLALLLFTPLHRSPFIYFQF